jgi:hypothetical protein
MQEQEAKHVEDDEELNNEIIIGNNTINTNTNDDCSQNEEEKSKIQYDKEEDKKRVEKLNQIGRTYTQVWVKNNFY